MPTTQVFVTGPTGYIGGDAFYVLNEAHPDWEYTCLVRNSEKGASVAARYPRTRLVYGELASTALIEEESRKADIVLNFANADDETSVNAIIAGLSTHEPHRPGFLISTSGTGILCYPDIDIKSFGEASNKIWDDVSDIADIRSIPDHAPHRNVDKIILAAGSESDAAKSGSLRTALVCPPTIYGVGRGPGNTRSMQIPGLAEAFLKAGEGWYIGQGLTKWSNVHVADLSNLYLILCEEASEGGNGAASWGAEGYYFAENGEHVWSDISKKLAKTAKDADLLKTDDTKSISADAANEYDPFGSVLWGANSRSRATRARKLLGWTPKHDPIEKTLLEALNVEVSRLGMSSKGHAQKAAGD